MVPRAKSPSSQPAWLRGPSVGSRPPFFQKKEIFGECAELKINPPAGGDANSSEATRFQEFPDKPKVNSRQREPGLRQPLVMYVC